MHIFNHPYCRLFGRLDVTATFENEPALAVLKGLVVKIFAAARRLQAYG